MANAGRAKRAPHFARETVYTTRRVWYDGTTIPTKGHIMENPLGALAIAAALNDGRTFDNHPSHSFTGIDGRCFDCDCRPWGRHAPNPCPVAR